MPKPKEETEEERKQKGDAKGKAIDPQEMKELADEFHKAFFKELGNAYPLTDTPGPVRRKSKHGRIKP